MPDVDDRQPDDTIETRLVDDLLSPTDPETLGPPAADGASASTDPTPPVGDPAVEDEYDLEGTGRRSRVTTGLIIALIFALGVLVGVLVARQLSPAPPPRIVYVLNDSGDSSARAPSSVPTPSDDPTR